MTTRWRNRALPLFAAILVFASCASENKGARLTWKDDAGPAESSNPARPERAPRARGGVVRVPENVMKQLMAFVNTQKFVIADRIAVDASRIPFQMALVPVFDPGYVERVEMAVPGVKAKGLLLRTRTRAPTVERDFPRVRLGDGVDLVATHEIRARIYSEVDRNRPVFLKIRALGHAVYRDETGRRLEKDSITLEASAVSHGEAMVFRSSIY